MDDLLSDLPSEACHPDLARNVRHRLAAMRRRTQAARWAGQGLLLAAAGAGAWLLVPRAGRLGGLVPSLPRADLISWAQTLVASPASAIWRLVTQVVDQEPALAAGIGFESALAVVLLALSALWALRGLMGPQAVDNGGM
jgi:hypothetical protein